ncbi:hypothetical protein [Halopiger goleimassiliensis]|uniref:hypothetical protein n=1 Tax=Halopiger goleimassiliensis TaxID=1293048 RepID=UPI0006775E53|nr:hypothetical protein [Halopiger goleimassiliensis]
MADTDDDREGFRDGLEASEGDRRVLVVLNAVLSGAFAWLLVWGAALVDLVAFSPSTVAVVAVGVFLLTFVVTRP